MTTFLPATDTRMPAAAAPQAVLLDMDGTLVDTEGVWWDVEVEVFAELGHTLADNHREVVVGGPMTRSAGYLIEATGAEITIAELAPRLNAAFLARIDRGVTLMPGAERLLRELNHHRVPTALVSASHRSVVDRMVTALGAGHFTLTVAGSDLTRNKPHPDPYLTAAAGLGAVPEQCVAVEDTATGVAAAEAAGCRVIAVPSLAPIAPAHRRTVVDSLAEVDLASLRSLWAEPPVAARYATGYWPGRTSPLS
jgi:HAD superfamily hydrolase (TIGR01509 family)